MGEKVLERKDMVFHNHIENHFKKEHPDWKVMCKICGKSFDQIIKEEGSKLVSVRLASESVDLKALKDYCRRKRADGVFNGTEKTHDTAIWSWELEEWAKNEAKKE